MNMSSASSYHRRLIFRQGRGVHRLPPLLALALVLCWQLIAQAAVATEGAKDKARAAPGADGDRPPAHLLTPEMAAEGRRLFDVYCSACHGMFGAGAVCPNLTDSMTLHGPRYMDMVRVISEGVATTGMPRWISKLGADKVAIVAAFVFSLRGTGPDDPDGANPERQKRLRQGLMVWMPAARLLVR
jgi:mono/diheme cytochrome c family protein